jgi:hypothetical protein
MAEYRKWPNQYKVWRDKEQTCDAVISATKHKIKIQQKYLLHCTLCETGDENIYHFLLVCSSLKSTRERHLQKIQEYLNSLRNGLYQDIQDADMLVQLLMDCTSQEINYGIRIKQKQYMEMESLCRIFCYDMHVSRLRQMAGKEYRVDK